MQENPNSKYVLHSVANTLDIIDLLAKHEELTVPEIASLTGFNKSSVFRMLATLEEKNFVHKSADAKYSLDVKLIFLGNTVSRRLDVIKFGHPMLMELTKRSGETSHIHMLDRDVYVRVIDKVLSPSTIRTDSFIGFCRRAHLMAGGKAILAFQTPSFLESYSRVSSFEPLTDYSITSPEQLMRELKEVRRLGYALDREESEYGLFCIGAPIFNASRNVIAAVSISGPVDRMKKNFDANLPLVLKTAEDISEFIS